MTISASAPSGRAYQGVDPASGRIVGIGGAAAGIALPRILKRPSMFGDYGG